MSLIVWGVVAAVVLILAASSVRIVQEYERAVIFRLGRVAPTTPRGSTTRPPQLPKR